MDKLILAIKTAFATEYCFFIKAQNFHWNVEGPDFQQFHELFGKIYEEVYGSIDAFAENIRKSGSYTPASLTRFSMLSLVEDETQVMDAHSMATELLQDSDRVAELMRVTFEMAEAAGEHGLSNFLADRQDAHRKHSWMLRAILK